MTYNLCTHVLSISVSWLILALFCETMSIDDEVCAFRCILLTNSVDIGWTEGIRALEVVLVPEPRIYARVRWSWSWNWN